MSCIYNMHNVSVASDISVAPDISDDTPYRYMYTPYRYKYTPVGYIPSRGMSSQAHAYVHAYAYACVLRK